MPSESKNSSILCTYLAYLEFYLSVNLNWFLFSLRVSALHIIQYKIIFIQYYNVNGYGLDKMNEKK